MTLMEGKKVSGLREMALAFATKNPKRNEGTLPFTYSPPARKNVWRDFKTSKTTSGFVGLRAIIVTHYYRVGVL